MDIIKIKVEIKIINKIISWLKKQNMNDIKIIEALQDCNFRKEDIFHEYLESIKLEKKE
jgi:hypothetical protein